MDSVAVIIEFIATLVKYICVCVYFNVINLIGEIRKAGVYKTTGLLTTSMYVLPQVKTTL